MKRAAPAIFLMCSSVAAVAQPSPKNACEATAWRIQDYRQFGPGEEELKFELGQRTLLVGVKVGKPLDANSAREALGAVARPVSTTMHGLTVKTTDYQFEIPHSAYSDMGDPGRMGVASNNPKQLTLVINGSDGAGGWTACLEFNEKKIIKRTITSWQRILQETLYRAYEAHVDKSGWAAP